MESSTKINELIDQAKQYMLNSKDPLHDITHVERVVKFTEKLSGDFKLTKTEKEALLLAAWWHDVGRTVVKKTSFLWMAACDDIMSAFILLKTAKKYNIQNKVTRRAASLLFLKALGNNESTKKVTPKKTRLLLYILRDADDLDLFNIKRYIIICNLTETSKFYYWAYRTIVWWSFHTRKLQMKTQTARKYLEQLVRQLLEWVKQKTIYNWHVYYFGKEWAEKTLKRIEIFCDNIVLLNLQAKSA